MLEGLSAKMADVFDGKEQILERVMLSPNKDIPGLAKSILVVLYKNYWRRVYKTISHQFEMTFFRNFSYEYFVIKKTVSVLEAYKCIIHVVVRLYLILVHVH